MNVTGEAGRVLEGPGQHAYCSCPFPRLCGSSLDLSALLSFFKGHCQMDVLVEDGASMLVTMRIARNDNKDNVDGSATHAYVTEIGLAGRHTLCVVDAAWLDRHLGPSL